MEIILEGSRLKTIEDFHREIKNVLELPDYYGNNLDALWDCLTGWIETPVTLIEEVIKLPKEISFSDRMNELVNKIENVNTKEDFISFLELLVRDLKNNPNEWENRSLEAYLEAAASWTDDMEGYYQNTGLAMPQNINWRVFANILMAAKMYE